MSPTLSSVMPTVRSWSYAPWSPPRGRTHCADLTFPAWPTRVSHETLAGIVVGPKTRPVGIFLHTSLKSLDCSMPAWSTAHFVGMINRQSEEGGLAKCDSW